MEGSQEQKLSANSLSIGESIIMGTAGAAPAFSVSATTATLVASMGMLAPASIFYCGIIMFGITLAFIHLNRIKVNAGAAYTWVGTIFGKSWGFFAGWALLVASVVFMVSGSIPAATATLFLIAPDLVSNPVWVTFVAALWLTFIAAVTCKGIKPTSYLQVLMTGIEVIILVIIIVAALWKFYNSEHHFSFSWFGIHHFTPGLFAKGALTALFLYWGWDVTLNLNEETKNTRQAPGWGAFWSVLIIMLLFVSFSVIALMTMSKTEIEHSGTNLIFTIAEKIFPRPWSYLAVLSVLLSSAGTLETTIVQFTRTMFAAGRDKALNQRYAKLHPSWNTPWVAILFIWGLGLLFLFLSSFFPTVTLIIKDSIQAIGFQVAFYYSLAGLACAWYYRSLWKNLGEMIAYVIWPSASALFLIFIACFSIHTFDLTTNIVGIGGIALGIIPLVWNLRLNHAVKP